MDHTYTTALYLFSSLLQADAAILGFGAIFIIYKLQALDSSYQDAFRTCLSAGHSEIENVAKLIAIASTDQDKEALLKRIDAGAYYDQCRRLITIPQGKSKLKRAVKWPLIATIVHISFSTIALWLIPKILCACGELGLSLISWLVIFLFIALVSYVGVLANTIVKEDV